MENIIFIGGVHGSGKGTICREITSKYKIKHLTASDVLKWNDISEKNSKKVINIKETQNRLIVNLGKITNTDEVYLLDGHFCLLNSLNQPEKIPIQTFIDINPRKIILVIADSSEIKSRLEIRDNKAYQQSLIEDFQNLEIEYANEISKKLLKPILIVNSLNYDLNNLLNFIK
ncbi:ATP-binding protein [uncultured Chryseobacterium sp.]|uniref:ATP-binding protein n=1 Tax=uncultured Chryseobacterium sp. TaxID=259322 RepID=UPI0025DC75E1|nr:ATP-binding protein [uncultured Chryseobacterium sp.]